MNRVDEYIEKYICWNISTGSSRKKDDLLLAFVVFYQELEAPSVYTVIYHHTWFVASNLVHSSRGFVYFEIQPHRSPAGVWVLGWKQHWGNLLSLAKKLSVIINGFRNFEHVPASYLSLIVERAFSGSVLFFLGTNSIASLGRLQCCHWCCLQREMILIQLFTPPGPQLPLRS